MADKTSTGFSKYLTDWITIDEEYRYFDISFNLSCDNFLVIIYNTSEIKNTHQAVFGSIIEIFNWNDLASSEKLQVYNHLNSLKDEAGKQISSALKFLKLHLTIIETISEEISFMEM